MFVTFTGCVAETHLSLVKNATLLGNTSSGAFLQLPDGWVVFLSREKFRGPLTLNLFGDLKGLSGLSPGDSVEIYPDRFYLPTTDLLIDRAQSQIWKTAPPARPALHADQYGANLMAVAQLVLQARKPGALAEHLPWVLDWEDWQVALQNEFSTMIALLRQSLRDCETSLMAQAFQGLSGMGTGLTPSGDDLILGLLLTLNRWGNVLRPGLNVTELNRTMREFDFHTTTTLSANLIACAMENQANERLVLALDGILTGEPGPEECASYLLGWGNSSGTDALVGIALAICG